jgi:hypothetical protein
MENLRKFLVVYLLSFALIATGVNILTGCDKKGSECDSCDSNSDCADGLTCEMFDDDKTRCANVGTTVECKTYSFGKDNGFAKLIENSDGRNSDNSSITAP